MDAIENQRSTALEVVTCGRRHGMDLDPWRNDSMFREGRRWIFLWRKINALPCTGPADAPEGTLFYNLQGAVGTPPAIVRVSFSRWRGAWSEAGKLESVEAAFRLVKSWIVDGDEVDDLPRRYRSRANW